MEENTEESSVKEVSIKVSHKERVEVNQLKWFFIIFGTLMFLSFILIWISIESKSFNFSGIGFTKERFGQIDFYTTTITGYGIREVPINYKLNLRNDPRELDVPVIGEINFLEDGKVYFALNLSSNISQCGSPISLVNFGHFMSGIGFDLVTAVPDEAQRDIYEKPVANCKAIINHTVLILTSGNETKIYQDSENLNCYVIEFTNCEEKEALEKFEVETLISLTN